MLDKTSTLLDKGLHAFHKIDRAFRYFVLSEGRYCQYQGVTHPGKNAVAGLNKYRMSPADTGNTAKYSKYE